MDPKDLIKFYNALVALMVEGRFRPSYGRRGGFRMFNQKNLDMAGRLLEWMGEQCFAVKPYIAGAFGDHNWCYQPRFERLKQQRYQDAYKNGEAWRWWCILEREDQFAEKPTGVHPGHEIIKASYYARGDHGLGRCYYNRMAGRFDPLSKYCQLCVHKDVCR